MGELPMWGARASALAVVAAIAAACAAFDAAETADAAADGGATGDGASAADARAFDGAVPVLACAVGQLMCNGACVSATDCTGCGGAPFLCPTLGTCLASCATCPGNAPGSLQLRIECVACTPSQTNPIATCVAQDSTSFCLSGIYSTAYNGAAGEHCDCSGTKVSNCISDSHVCRPQSDTDWCLTCGEPTTSGLLCKNGKTCNQGTATCE